jgi:ADP-heptose:LPS heptosyltransferase
VTGRVLLLRALGLGDFLTGVPAYRAVRRAFPGHLIVLAAPGRLADLVPLTGAIDELLPAAELEPVAWTGAAPDVAIDLHGRGPASHRLVAALGPQRLITFGGRHGGGFAGPKWRAGEHEVARWCRLCSESGIPADPADLRLTAVPGTAPPAPSGAVPSAPAGPGLTIVHPGAAAPSRRWPPGRFAAVAGELARLGHQVVVTGSAAERPLAMDVARRAGLPPQSVLAGRTSLAALAALAASARLVVSGDTGLAHLATAYARPSVVVFGPVPPAEWGPPADPRHQALWAGGDGYRGDPHGCRTDPALAAIRVSDVLRATERALAAGRPPLSPARR